ncbi:hypothetical protein [Paraglaciecola hydrolytica]|uniref:STAS domain-containing protein n=1 Tax=Paraglaciecola hydrolytica TaxID=1799789 RepID=A0A136A254_9ALTE|nr:hypothetical protein [Paraglaciecola hydrolytica]KXI29294.1 hypothetical protein AX660_14220 [Paraglaciecola hydrolytica]
MQYEISVNDTCVSVIFEGNLRAIDLIFMYRDPHYREAILGKNVLFLDFSNVTGSELTAEDTQGLLLMSKLDPQKAKNMQLVILVNPGRANNISKLCENIFSDSSWHVNVCESKEAALKLL